MTAQAGLLHQSFPCTAEPVHTCVCVAVLLHAHDPPARPNATICASTLACASAARTGRLHPGACQWQQDCRGDCVRATRRARLPHVARSSDPGPRTCAGARPTHQNPAELNSAASSLQCSLGSPVSSSYDGESVSRTFVAGVGEEKGGAAKLPHARDPSSDGLDRVRLLVQHIDQKPGSRTR